MKNRITNTIIGAACLVLGASISVNANAREKSDPYAFRESQEYANFFNGTRWEYCITILPGDTFESIARETQFDADFLRRTNLELGIVEPNSDMENLTPGKRIRVYLPISGEESYRKEHPERNLKRDFN